MSEKQGGSLSVPASILAGILLLSAPVTPASVRADETAGGEFPASDFDAIARVQYEPDFSREHAGAVVGAESSNARRSAGHARERALDFPQHFDRGTLRLALLQDQEEPFEMPQDMPADEPPPDISSRPRVKHFGAADTSRIDFAGWYASDFDHGQISAGGFALTHFFVDNWSIGVELNYVSVEQDGPDAWGGMATLMLRWHLINEPGWSLYLDGGGGIFKTNDDVPADGSNYNMAILAGTGISFDVGRDWRAMLGARWLHVSNANTADSNPGRDHVQFYGGLSIPF